MRRLDAALVALLLLGVACAQGEPAAQAPRTAPAPADQPPGADQRARTAALLDFALPTLGGGTLEGASLASTDLVLWFWAPW